MSLCRQTNRNRMAITLEFVVEPYLSGVRIDSFLEKQLRNYTAWRLHRMVSEGLASVDDMPAGRNQRVFRGQQVRIRLVEPPDKLLPPTPRRLTIHYEDPWLMVIDKPVGLVAHPVGDFQSGTLSNVLQDYLDSQSAARGLLRPGIVHRLDRMTSGLIVVTKQHLAHRLLSMDFQQGRLSKSYLALVEGRPDFTSLTIDLPIGRSPGAGSVLMSAGEGARQARPSRTKVTVRQRWKTHSLVHCCLFTGRNHQIRVHLAEIGHPVLGDPYYGPRGRLHGQPTADAERSMQHRHALHAAHLGFQHPLLNHWMEFETSAPADFWALAPDLPAGEGPSHGDLANS